MKKKKELSSRFYGYIWDHCVCECVCVGYIFFCFFWFCVCVSLIYFYFFLIVFFVFLFFWGVEIRYIQSRLRWLRFWTLLELCRMGNPRRLHQHLYFETYSWEKNINLEKNGLKQWELKLRETNSVTTLLTSTSPEIFS